MRAVTITQPGDLDVLTVGERPSRDPGPDEIRIAVHAAAVNPTDIGLRRAGGGDLPAPWIPGMDLAGTVEEVGSGAQRLRAGDGVMAAVSPRRPEGGAQAELVVVPEASAVAMPEGATFDEAATLPMNGLTAQLGLDMLGLASGTTLAVTGGAGLLASYVIALAARRGLTVVADARDDDRALVEGFGAHHVVPRGNGFADAVRAIAPDGADGLYDTALLGSGAFGALRDGGPMAVVRGWDDTPTERGIEIHKVMVVEALERTDWLEELRDMAERGELAMRVAARYPPEEAAEAQRLMDAGGLRGRAIIAF